MRAAIALGLRLAVRTSAEARVRTAMVAFAAGVGTLVIMSALAIAAADRSSNPFRYEDGGMARLVALTIAVIVLQVAGLAGVSGRLAATLRSRRLANLRLLGMSAGHTRMVAAIEVGPGAAVGAAIGIATFPLVRILLSRVEIASQRWSTEKLAPPSLAWVAVPVGVACAVVAVAVLPERLSGRDALRQVRRAEPRFPSLLRILPLLAGAALSIYMHTDHTVDQSSANVMIAAICLTGLGTVLVLPVFVQLTAVLLVRTARRGPALIAGRRLQAQPAGMARVVTGLLLGLFVVTGARNVVAAFEATPQYATAERSLHEAQRLTGNLGAGDVDAMLERLRSFPGVRDVAVIHRLGSDCDASGDLCLRNAIVADCPTLKMILPAASGCQDGKVMQVGTRSDPAGGERTWRPALAPPDVPGLVVPEPEGTIEPGGSTWVDFELVIPPSYDGAAAVTATGLPSVAIVGEPGTGLDTRLAASGLVPDATAGWSQDDYRFVDLLRTTVYSIAALIVGIGLLSFAIAAIDRATQRRRELVSLRLLGVPAAGLRASQMVESLVPISIGTALAVALGQLAGSTYLAYGDSPELPTDVPWAQTFTIGAIAALGGVLVAALTVVATNQAIRPGNIRSE